jgi:hypothetical protein
MTSLSLVQLLSGADAGVRPFSEVRSQVEAYVMNEKRKEITYDRVRQLICLKTVILKTCLDWLIKRFNMQMV